MATLGDDDPLIPDHVLSRRTLRPVTTAERDRLNFEVIRAGTRCVLVLSRSERSAKGSMLSPSALWPAKLCASAIVSLTAHSAMGRDTASQIVCWRAPRRRANFSMSAKPRCAGETGTEKGHIPPTTAWSPRAILQLPPPSRAHNRQQRSNACYVTRSGSRRRDG